MHFFNFLFLKSTYIHIMYCLCTITKQKISKERKFCLFLAVCDKNHMWYEVCVACNVFSVLVSQGGHIVSLLLFAFNQTYNINTFNLN